VSSHFRFHTPFECLDWLIVVFYYKCGARVNPTVCQIQLLICSLSSFFAFRIWRVSSRNWIVTSIIGISSAGQFGAGMAFSNHLIKSTGIPLANAAGRIQLICSIVCDITISASLAYYFFIFRTGMRRSNHILQHLIILSINMGVLLCLVAIATFILFQIKSGSSSLVTLAPHFILIKLYINSLLATLNSRKHFRVLAQRTIEFELPTIPSTPDVPTGQQDSDP